jgi:hypothetical protein
MATLHLPKHRRKKEQAEAKLDRQLDAGLEQTFPASDPVAATTPGGPVGTDGESKQKSAPDMAAGA